MTTRMVRLGPVAHESYQIELAGALVNIVREHLCLAPHDSYIKLVSFQAAQRSSSNGHNGGYCYTKAVMNTPYSFFRLNLGPFYYDNLVTEI